MLKYIKPMGMQEAESTVASPRTLVGVNRAFPPAHKLRHSSSPVGRPTDGNGRSVEYEFDSRRMSAPELPPIAQHRSLSSPSYSGTTRNKGMKSPTIFKYETISRNKRHSIHTSPTALSSPGNSPAPTPRSGSSGNTCNGSGGIEDTPRTVAIVPLGQQHRAKSWCAIENNSGSNPKLETLFEANNNVLNFSLDGRQYKKGTSRSQSEYNEGLLSIMKRGSTQSNMNRNSPKLGISSSTKHQPNKQEKQLIRTRHYSEQSSSLSRNNTTFAVNGDSKTDSSKSDRLQESNLSTLNKQNGRCSGDDCDSDNGEDKEERIINWLIGVETSAETPPPLPNIEDRPEKTDTAIHIIYDGD